MGNASTAGYEEVEHTADWQLNVWAPTLEELFVQAARGMYSLSNIQFDDSRNELRELSLQEEDFEILLISFLSELLYYVTSEHLAFDITEINIRDTHLSAGLVGGRITRHDKEIKAVTYHGIDIEQLNNKYRVSVVFDV